MSSGVSPRTRRRLSALAAAGLALVPATVAGSAAGAALLTVRPAAAQAPTVVISTIPVSLRTTPTYVAVEAYYNGSSFAGGGIIKVFVTQRITFSDDTVREVEREVSWYSSDESIVYLGPCNWAVTPEGLYIDSQTRRGRRLRHRHRRLRGLGGQQHRRGLGRLGAPADVPRAPGEQRRGLLRVFVLRLSGFRRYC